MMLKESVKNAKIVVYHKGFLYVQDESGQWYVDDFATDPARIHISFKPTRYVVSADGILLLAEHGIAEVKGREVVEWVGLEKAWAPLGWPADGKRTVYGQSISVRDREDIHGLPVTRTHTWWLSGQIGLKGSYEIVGGKPTEMRWVFNNRKPFVYWNGVIGELQFGEPCEAGVPYGESVPIVGAKDRYYFSRDGHVWFMRRVEGWTFATKRGLLSLLPDGRIEAVKGIL
ncbi:lectin-like sugar binding domain protein [Thermus phage TSP4]|nr:lectin-like sugar binding domain protein [Thermus phage TSP4]